MLGRGQVLLGPAMTVFGFAGLFVVFTYIQPILTHFTGFSEAAVSPILLVSSVGLAIGNVVGGKLADRGLARALTDTLATLAIVLLGLAAVLSVKILTIALILLLGIAAFATVAPLQLRVLEAAGPSGRTLASSLNIAAFNLGNPLGAWAGGVTIDRGLGLAALPLVAAGITAIVAPHRLLGDDRRPRRGATARQSRGGRLVAEGGAAQAPRRGECGHAALSVLSLSHPGRVRATESAAGVSPLIPDDSSHWWSPPMRHAETPLYRPRSRP